MRMCRHWGWWMLWGLLVFRADVQPAGGEIARVVKGEPRHPYPLARAVEPGEVPEWAGGWTLEVKEGRATLAGPLAKGESLHGLGERMDAWDLRGRKVRVWLEDRIQGGLASSYFAVPFVISSRGYGVFVNCTGAVEFDLGADEPNRLRITVPEGGLDVYFLRGTLPEIVSSYTSLAGRPQEVPDWVWKLWISRNSYLGAEEIDGILDRLERERIPAGVVVLEAWAEHLQTFTFERRRYPDPERWIASLHDRGYAVVAWITPSILPQASTYPAAREQGFLVKKADGSELVLDWLENGRKINFADPAARAWWTDLHRPLVKMGVDGFKTDGGERNPDPFFHNLQPYYYQKASLDAFAGSGKPGVTFARSACVSAAANSLFWAGDQWADWTHLATLPRAGMSAGLGGFAFWGFDIGGYINTPARDLYIRWFQLGALAPIMQWHGISAREPWLYDDETLAIARYYAALRVRLEPILKGLAEESRARGFPFWRPLAWAYPADPKAWKVDDQFLLGNDLLVAPMLGPGSHRSVYLPEGDWVDAFRGMTHAGPVTLDYRAPLAQIPVFVRADKADRYQPLWRDFPPPLAGDVAARLIGPANERGVVPLLQPITAKARASLFLEVRNDSDKPAAMEVDVKASAGLKLLTERRRRLTLAPGKAKRIAVQADIAKDREFGTESLAVSVTAQGEPLLAETVRYFDLPEWRAIGPFALDAEAGPAIASPDAHPEGVAGLGGRRLNWHGGLEKAVDPEGFLDLTGILHAPSDTAVYAATVVESKSAGPATLSIGSGDAVTVWLNGEKVLQRDTYRNSAPDQDMAAVELNQGANEIVVELRRNIGPHRLFFRLERPGSTRAAAATPPTPPKGQG